MINFKCTRCEEPLEAPQSMSNEVLECPNCGQKVLVPEYQKYPKAKRSSNKKNKVQGYLPYLFSMIFMILYVTQAIIERTTGRDVASMELEFLFLLGMVICLLFAEINKRI